MRSRNNQFFMSAIVVAAGAGKRFGGSKKKQFFKINGRELFLYSVDALRRSNLAGEIVVVLPAADVKRFNKLLLIDKVKAVVSGGQTRAQSVQKGLNAVSDSADYVLIQDGARPFLKQEYIKQAVRALKSYDGAVTAVKLTDTIKESASGEIIEKTLPRKNLYRAQTPQVFKKNILLEAYSKSNTEDATDDSELVESIGGRIKIITGSNYNIKITTKEDLGIIRSMLKNK